MTNEGEPNTPPIEWYEGIAFQEEGIRRVLIGSRAFVALHPDMHTQLLTWQHCSFYGARIGQGNLLASALTSAEFILQLTGFHPKELQDYSSQLTADYAGKFEAPFTISWL